MKPHPIPDEQLIAFAAKELGGDAFVTIEAHVAFCVRCTKLVTRFQHVQAILRNDDTRIPPTYLVAKAYNIFPRPKPQITLLGFFQNLNPFQSFVGATLGIFALLIGIVVGIAQLDMTTENMLYPVKSAVEEIETGVSNTWQSLGGSLVPIAPSGTIVPPTRTITPLPSPTRVPATPTLVVPVNIPSLSDPSAPGTGKTPPGLATILSPLRTPPNQLATPGEIGRERATAAQTRPNTPKPTDNSPKEDRTPGPQNTREPRQVPTSSGPNNNPSNPKNNPTKPNSPQGDQTPPGQSKNN